MRPNLAIAKKPYTNDVRQQLAEANRVFRRDMERLNEGKNATALNDANKAFMEQASPSFGDLSGRAPPLGPAMQYTGEAPMPIGYSSGSDAKMNNVRAVYERLLSHGLQPHQAAAVVGRFQQESGPGLNPGIVGDGGMSVGIGQWNRERLANLKRFGGSNWQDPLVQADFFVQEGKGPESRAFNMIKNSKTLGEATLGAMAYERPQGFTWENPAAGHGYANTVRNAQAIAGGNMPAALSPGAQDFVLNNPQPGGFGPGVPDPNAPLFGSMAPGGGDGSGGGMMAQDTSIPMGVANYLGSLDDGSEKLNPLEKAGAYFSKAAKAHQAPGINGAFGGDARSSGDALQKLLANPRALAQMMMQRRMA